MIGLQAIGPGRKDRSSVLGKKRFSGEEGLTYQRKLSAKSVPNRKFFCGAQNEIALLSFQIESFSWCHEG